MNILFRCFVGNQTYYGGKCMSLSSKELMLLQDNIKMLENSIKFLSGATSICSDPQVKTMCDTMSREHANDLKTLAKFISNTNLQ